MNALAFVLLGTAGTGQAGVEFAEIGAVDARASGVETEFDWVVKSGESLIFDTVSEFLVDVENGLFLTVENGVLLVNDITIEAGAEVRVVGPNPLRILATGEVNLDGRIDVSGFQASDVQSLNLAQSPQPGGLGGPGGGSGGIGSPLTTSSSPRGGDGNGPFGLMGIGGQGGETGYATSNRNWRRPGGGGGGAFGPNADLAGVGPDPQEPEKGLIAQPGFDGFDSTLPGFQSWSPPPLGSFGAETGLVAASGGSVGLSPFKDARSGNDFWGVKVTETGALVHGELKFLAAGTGGGAGGDAIDGDTFPSPVFIGSNGTTAHDYKGGGGGGGGGALHLVCLDEIRLGSDAELVSNGGGGGTGESTFFIDRIGGGGGGGSGGHVVLESERIVFDEPSDGSAAISALGGSGGLGLPIGDNPEGTSEFNEIFLIMQRRVNEGGTGGPGVIQLHVPLSASGDPEGNVVLPDGYSLEQLTEPRAQVLLPMFLPQIAER